MTDKYPFHYKVVFKYIVYTKENEVINRTVENVFHDDDPLINRAKAFADVKEYLSYLKEHNRVAVNKQGNYIITQPGFLHEKIEKIKEQVRFYDITEEYESFKESISIYLIVTDEKIAEKLDFFKYEEQYQLEHLIYRISSQEVNQQEMVDNLEMVELELYSHFDISVGGMTETVYHYDVDYAESGEDEESGAMRTILKVPFNWITLESYTESMSKFREETETNSVDYKSIISRGESNQIEFKPTLVYNFATGKGSIKVKYIIAKVICSFLNSNGGTLFIGVKDDGTVQGLDYDYSLFESGQRDKVLLELDDLISRYFGSGRKPLIEGVIQEVNGKEILVVEVAASEKPVFLNNQFNGVTSKEFYIRMHASTRILIDVEEIVEYILTNRNQDR